MCAPSYSHQIGHFPLCYPEWPSLSLLQWDWSANSCSARLPLCTSYFSLHLEVTNNTMAELWGIREALARAWAKGHHRVFLQTDSLLAYKWLKTNEDYLMEFANLILDCRWLLNRDWEACIDHIWREANSRADLLAKRGASQLEREVLYDTCPTFLWQCLYWDSMDFVSSWSRG